MTQLCLVRHGQTDWNLEGRYQGQSDVPLNEKGRKQAGMIARQLQGQSLSAIYTSDLRRARETAEIIAGTIQLPVILEARLREVDLGEWEGQLVEVIKIRYAELWQQRDRDPTHMRPPGGETVGEVAHRVYSALNDIARLHPTGAVLVISHGLALGTVLCKDRDLPVGKAYSISLENTEPVWINWKD